MGEIRRFLRDDGMIRVARPVKDLYATCMNLSQSMYYTLGREPTLGAVSYTHLDVYKRQVCNRPSFPAVPWGNQAALSCDGGWAMVE